MKWIKNLDYIVGKEGAIDLIQECTDNNNAQTINNKHINEKHGISHILN